MVAPTALAFCSNQKCTVFNSWMRLSNSSGSSVGATQPGAAALALAPGVRFFKKSKPGTNLVKSKPLGLPMRVSWWKCVLGLNQTHGACI